MDGQDIKGSGNQTMPVWPEGVSDFRKILCLLGYHGAEIRFAPRRIRDMDGEQLGVMRLRDQCPICLTLLNSTVKNRIRIAAARAYAEAQPVQQRWER